MVRIWPRFFQEQVFAPWQMKETTFGPVSQAVPTLRGVPAGVVHDPKARVLGVHAGSAGLFSTIRDMEIFLEHYLQDPFCRDFIAELCFRKREDALSGLESGRRLVGPYRLYRNLPSL